MKQVNSRWRVIAIIFVVLTIIFLITSIIQLLYISFAINEVNNYFAKETTCAVNVCDGYDSYTYDHKEIICKCYNKNELMLTKYIID